MDSYSMTGGEFETAGEFAGESGGLDGVVVGIPATSIVTLLSADITVRPTQQFRAQRLVLDAVSRAALMSVDQISIASVAQNRGNGPVPAELFTPDATHRLRGDIVDPATGIILSVTNGTAGTVVVGGAFFGPARSV